MPNRQVMLTEHQVEMVDDLVASGRYQNAGDVVREGLRLVERRETEEQTRLAALRDAARIGIEDADAGRYVSFDSAAALRRHLDSMTEESIARSEASTATT